MYSHNQHEKYTVASEKNMLIFTRFVLQTFTGLHAIELTISPQITHEPPPLSPATVQEHDSVTPAENVVQSLHGAAFKEELLLHIQKKSTE